MKELLIKHRKLITIYLIYDVIVNVALIGNIFNIGIMFEKIANDNWQDFLFYLYFQIGLVFFIFIFSLLKFRLKNDLTKKMTIGLQEYFLLNIEYFKKRNNKLDEGAVSSLLLKTVPLLIENQVFVRIYFLSGAILITLVIGIIFYYYWLIAIITIASILFIVSLSFFLSKKIQKLTVSGQEININSDKNFNKYFQSFNKFAFLNAISNFKIVLNNESIDFTQKNIKLEGKKILINSPIVLSNSLFLMILYVAMSIFYVEDFLSIESFITLPVFFGILLGNTQKMIYSLIGFNSFRKISQKWIPKKNELIPKMNLEHEVKSICFKNFNIIINKNKLFKKDLNLIFKQNNKYLITGSSGVGKSSIFKSIFDEDINYTGEVFINNISIKKLNKKSIFKNIFFIESESQMFNMSVENNIFMLKDKSSLELDRVLKIVNLNKEKINSNAFDLSQGERQKVALASYLVKHPKWIIMDEALSNLDKINSQKIMKNLSNSNISIINISHSLSSKIDYNEKIYIS